jgi:hypothetical protein
VTLKIYFKLNVSFNITVLASQWQIFLSQPQDLPLMQENANCCKTWTKRSGKRNGNWHFQRLEQSGTSEESEPRLTSEASAPTDEEMREISQFKSISRVMN